MPGMSFYMLFLAFRTLAIVALPFAIVQLFGPLGELLGWLNVWVQPNLRFGSPSAGERFVRLSGHMLIGLAWLGLPALFWLLGEIANYLLGEIDSAASAGTSK